MADPAEQTQSTEGAAQPVPIVRGPGGRFVRAKGASLGSLSERMAAKDLEFERTGGGPRVEGDTEAPDDEEPAEEQTEAEPAAATPPAADKPAAGKPEPKPRRETVEVEPTEGDAKFTKERLAFTEWKRRQREAHEAQLRAERQQHIEALQADRSKFEEQVRTTTPRMEKAERVLQLMETADYENLAKEAGYEDWEKFQGHVLGTITDPNYKRTRELERKLAEREAKEKADLEEREAREKAEKADAEQRTISQQRTAAIQQHKQSLSAAMAQSTNKTVAAMADDPAFINTIFEIQRQNYDPSTQTTVSPEQAVRMAFRGAQRTIHEDLRLLRDRLNKADLDDPEQAAAAAAVAAAVTPAPAPAAKSKASKTAVVPAAATVEPAATGKYKGPKDPAWRQRFTAAMNEAAEQEEREQLAKRRARGR